MWSRRLDYLVYFAALSRVPWTDAGHMCMRGVGQDEDLNRLVMQ